MTYPTSGSILDKGINSSLSTQITIKVGPTTVGAIQSASLTQGREILIHEEIGTDGVVDSHPKGAARIELQVDRIVFDQMRLTEAFARGFINIQAQRIPFDIQIIDSSEQLIPTEKIRNAIEGNDEDEWGDKISKGADYVVKGTNWFSENTGIGTGVSNFSKTQNFLDQLVIVHVLHNCWFASYSPTWQADNFLVMEKATIKAEKVTTHRGGRNAVYGGLRGVQYEYDNIERNTDKDGRPGGLSNAADDPISMFDSFTRRSYWGR